LAYRKRTIPIAWTWVKHVKGHSTARKHLALLSYVRTLLPAGAAVFLVGDCEFGSMEVLRQLDQWKWFYVLRQKGRTHVWLNEEQGWRDFGSVVHKPGQSLWLGEGYLTEKEIYRVNLLAHWEIGEDEPWCLATNLPDRQMTLRCYARRMWIEEMFGDLKKHGFDLRFYSYRFSLPHRLVNHSIAKLSSIGILILSITNTSLSWKPGKNILTDDIRAALLSILIQRVRTDYNLHPAYSTIL
jgi:hypothetical protein